MRGLKSALGIAMGLTTLLLGDAAQAQGNYPNRAIRIVVPYPAGGIVDIVARAVTEQVGRDWNQTVVVEARPGGNSNIGTASVARSDPDGYTWLVTGPAALVNPTLYKDAGWDAMKGLKCVGLAIWNQSVAVVNPSLPVKTLAEFVELARSKPGQLNFGNAGTGSSLDLTAQKLFQAADIKLTWFTRPALSTELVVQKAGNADSIRASVREVVQQYNAFIRSKGTADFLFVDLQSRLTPLGITITALSATRDGVTATEGPGDAKKIKLAADELVALGDVEVIA